jgi:hypothetical protein
VLVGVQVEVEGLLPLGGGLDASTTPLFPLHPAACAVCCRGLSLAVVVLHSGGGAGTAPYLCLTRARHLDLHSSWRPGYMSRDSPSGGRVGNRLPVLV